MGSRLAGKLLEKKLSSITKGPAPVKLSPSSETAPPFVAGAVTVAVYVSVDPGTPVCVALFKTKLIVSAWAPAGSINTAASRTQKREKAVFFIVLDFWIKSFSQISTCRPE